MSRIEALTNAQRNALATAPAQVTLMPIWAPRLSTGMTQGAYYGWEIWLTQRSASEKEKIFTFE